MRPSLKTYLASLSAALALGVGSARAQAASASAPESDSRLYVAEIKTGPNWDHSKPPTDQNFFREHSANLKRLRDAGHIVLGARYADKGLVVFAAKSAAEVAALMNQDPSMSAGTFKYEVHEFNVFYSGSLQARPRR